MRLTLGGDLTVAATERWLTELRAGRAFSCSQDITPAAGNIAKFQLLNPAASGRRLLVAGLSVTVGAADTVFVSSHNVSLANPLTTRNLLLGGAEPGVAEFHAVGSAGAVGTALHRILLAAGAPFQWGPAPSWFAEVPEGQGLLVRTSTVVVRAVVSMLWAEV